MGHNSNNQPETAIGHEYRWASVEDSYTDEYHYECSGKIELGGNHSRLILGREASGIDCGLQLDLVSALERIHCRALSEFAQRYLWLSASRQLFASSSSRCGLVPDFKFNPLFCWARIYRRAFQLSVNRP